MRLLEVLLHGGTQITGWRSRQMHQAVLRACGLSADTNTLGPLRYDWRKMKAQRLVEPLGRSYCYRLTPGRPSRKCEFLDTSPRWWSQILDHGPIRNSAAGSVGSDARAGGRRSKSSAKAEPMPRCGAVS